ncbi:unnamed protein product [Leuciscus chuanchicus]
MFAYVRYIDDNIRQIVPLDNIKGFCPKDVKDFETKKKYSILWKKSPEDQGQYYKAQILKLAESEEELKCERISIPPLNSDEEDWSSTKSSTNPSATLHSHSSQFTVQKNQLEEQMAIILKRQTPLPQQPVHGPEEPAEEQSIRHRDDKDELYDHLEELEIMKVEKQVNEAMTWMNNKMNLQSKQSLSQDPAVKAQEIQAKTKKLYSSCNHIVSKPKPKVEPPKETAAEQNGPVNGQGDSEPQPEKSRVPETPDAKLPEMDID